MLVGLSPLAAASPTASSRIAVAVWSAAMAVGARPRPHRTGTDMWASAFCCRHQLELSVDSPVTPFDLQRMILGDDPLLFNLEILVRTIIVYAYALLLLRWLGSRAIGQLSTVEFLLVIALGSAIGDAMFYPEVPLLHALLVVTIVVSLNKGLDVLIASSKQGELFLDGRPSELIRDGVLADSLLEGDSLGRGEVFRQLRRHGIEHLGQVRYACVEPDGEVTVLPHRTDIPPGLPIVPPWEIAEPPKIEADETSPDDRLLACRRCGTLSKVAAGAAPGPCLNCRNETWTPARGDGSKPVLSR
jgi:uncharacterized membrane protein YcaP (DUF421 family)